MTLDARSCRMLEEMGLGPVWLLRETEDPLLLGAAAVRPAPGPAPALRQSPAAAKESLARPARQRPAAGQQNPPSARSAQPASAPVTVQAGLPPETAEAIASADWAALRKIAEGCRACAMASTRQHVVFSEGDPGPKLVIIGEAPGAEEDLQGIPFVGKSGQLLTAMLDALGIVRCELAGYEADDLLGTISRRANENGDECVILTGDRDSLQLVGGGTVVRLVKSALGKTTYTSYTPEKFREEYGFDPIRLIDLKALMGDSSDNIPGVKGVGEKSAKQLLAASARSTASMSISTTSASKRACAPNYRRTSREHATATGSPPSTGMYRSSWTLRICPNRRSTARRCTAC